MFLITLFACASENTRYASSDKLVSGKSSYDTKVIIVSYEKRIDENDILKKQRRTFSVILWRHKGSTKQSMVVFMRLWTRYECLEKGRCWGYPEAS